MPSRIHALFAALAVGGSLLAGCATSSSRYAADLQAAAREMQAGSGTNEIGLPNEDYSPAAVDLRIEAHARYAAGVLHELNNEDQAAAEDFAAAALADARNEGLVKEASERLLRLRKFDEARDLLLTALKDPKAPGSLHARLGLIYSLQEQPEKAIDACRQAMAKAPQDLAGYQLLAQIHLKKGQPAEAFSILDQAAREKNPSASFLVGLAELYIGLGRSTTNQSYKASALAVLERAAALAPTEPVLLHKLGEGFEFLGQPEKAAMFYVKLLERFPNLPELRESLVNIYLRKNDRKKAAEQLEALLGRNPTNPQIYYLLGSIKFEDRQPKEAEELFNKALLLNPSLEPVYYDLAAAQINQNQPQRALTTIQKARDKFKTGFVAEFYTALAYSRMKDYTNALRFLTAAEVVGRATETNRLTPVFYFQLGATHERVKQYAEAEKAFRRSLELAPDFAEALNYLGYMWADRNHNLDEARQMLERAVKLEPKNGAFLDSLGWVYYKLRRVQDALRLIQQAIEHSEEPDATLYDHLGDIYNTLNQPDQAREAWRKALTLDSIDDKEPIRKKLQDAGAGDRPH